VIASTPCSAIGKLDVKLLALNPPYYLPEGCITIRGAAPVHGLAHAVGAMNFKPAA